VVVPCHRLIGADGALVKYGGGLHRKKWLLEHEGAALKPAPVRRFVTA
jgi:methylated-DNA-[protein]-cysteine S-methyltransferase